MSKARFDTRTRAAIWRTNDCRCFYCSVPVSFTELDIDHIIAETTPPQRLRKLIKLLGLPKQFDVNSLLNLVPTHHSCNNRKSGENFSDQAMLFYIEMWNRKQDKLNHEYERLSRTALSDKQLITIAKIVEAGVISKEEIVRFILRLPTQTKPPISEPLVVTFSINVTEFLATNNLPQLVSKEYYDVCDWLEKDLSFRLLRALPILSQQTEESARNGETLSVRIAFWNLDIDRLDDFDTSPWEILEIAPFSEIYNHPADELLSRSVVSAYHNLINDPFGYLDGIGRCPRCGSDKLRGNTQVDEALCVNIA